MKNIVFQGPAALSLPSNNLLACLQGAVTSMLDAGHFVDFTTLAIEKVSIIPPHSLVEKDLQVIFSNRTIEGDVTIIDLIVERRPSHWPDYNPDSENFLITLKCYNQNQQVKLLKVGEFPPDLTTIIIDAHLIIVEKE